MDTSKLSSIQGGWSYAEIQKDMLSQVAVDVDKREGSIMFNTLAPSAPVPVEAPKPVMIPMEP